MKAFMEKLRTGMRSADRRQAALAVFAAVCAVLMVTYLIPDEPKIPLVTFPKDAVAESSAPVRSSVNRSSPGRGKAELCSPFEESHPTRADRAKTAAEGMQPAGREEGSARAGGEPVRLVGTAVSQRGTRAIFSKGEEQWSMEPGDRRRDIVLREITKEQVIIETSEGEKILRLPGR